MCIYLLARLCSFETLSCCIFSHRRVVFQNLREFSVLKKLFCLLITTWAEGRKSVGTFTFALVYQGDFTITIASLYLILFLDFPIIFVWNSDNKVLVTEKFGVLLVLLHFVQTLVATAMATTVAKSVANDIQYITAWRITK